jgi:hypothetical protein
MASAHPNKRLRVVGPFSWPNLDIGGSRNTDGGQREGGRFTRSDVAAYVLPELAAPIIAAVQSSLLPI